MNPTRVAAVSCRNHIAQPDKSISEMESWCRRAKANDAKLVLFPELNVTGYIPAEIVKKVAEPVPGPSTERIIRIARKYDLYVAFGLVERFGSQLYCTHIVVNSEGIVGAQRKIHIPAHEQPFWTAGDSIEVFTVNGVAIGIAICRDAFFGEMTRTLYHKGAEVILMPFGYYNVPRSRYLQDSIHGMSIIKACWENGTYAVICNSASSRPPSSIEPKGRRFPGWAGIIDPWGEVVEFVDKDGDDESMVTHTLQPERVMDRRQHPNFLAAELRYDLYATTSQEREKAKQQDEFPG